MILKVEYNHDDNPHIDAGDGGDDDNDDDDDEEEEVGKVQTMCGRRGSWPDTPQPFLLIHILLVIIIIISMTIMMIIILIVVMIIMMMTTIVIMMIIVDHIHNKYDHWEGSPFTVFSEMMDFKLIVVQQEYH